MSVDSNLPNRRLVIGIAGGVASGKSLVTSCFAHFGAIVLDGDRVGHEVLRQPDVIQRIVDHWGPELLRDGEIDRASLGRIVFAEGPQGHDDLRQLEQILHPRIGQRLQARLEQFGPDDAAPAAVLDAPVMFKAGWDRMCDRIVFVEAPRSLRLQRARRRGWSEEELDRRESRQESIDVKRSRATDFLDNSGSKESTYQQAFELWREWGLPSRAALASPATLFES